MPPQLRNVTPQPVQRSPDLTETGRPNQQVNRRMLAAWLYPDEYIRLQQFCKARRVPISQLVRQILLAYIDKMEARERGDQR